MKFNQILVEVMTISNLFLALLGRLETSSAPF